MKMEHQVLADSPLPSVETEWEKVYAFAEDLKRTYPDRRGLVCLLYLGFLERFGLHWLALHCMGLSMYEDGFFSEAERYYQRALELNPNAANSYHGLALVRKAQGRLDEALAAFEKSLALKPWYSNDIESTVVYLKQVLCEWDGLDERVAGLRRIFSTHASAAVCPVQEWPNPFILMAANGSLKEQQECARRLARAQRRHDYGAAPFDFSARRTRNGPRRIGYLSSDFHEHATADLTAALFEAHDRQGFEIIAYSNGPDDGSVMRRRLLAAFDKFVDIRGLSDRAVAERIHADGIDILVDLKGYTTDNRSTVLGYRPAPLQVQFLGYPGTMGDANVDYLIADSFIVPKRHLPYYDEKIVHLPDCYQPNDPQRQIGAAPTRAEVGLPETGVVYCSFNQTYKITPAMFDIWMRILSAVPGSVLWILESNRWVAENLRREARARGVEDERLVFAPLLAPRAHFGRYQLADVMLDTLPCNAHTTASDALWVGVPVVTCPGETFAARVAGSLLHAMELPELVMSDLKQYEEKAIELGREPAVLAALKEKIRTQRATSALFDIGRFTRHLENAYERMWKRYVRGDAPDFIAVPRIGIMTGLQPRDQQISHLNTSLEGTQMDREKFQVTIISPPNYPHSAAFTELAETLVYGLRSLGYQARLSNNTLAYDGSTNIILGAHLLAHTMEATLPANSIIFNTEQIGSISDGLKTPLIELIRQYETWDYSLRNIELLSSLGGRSRIHHVSVGYVPQLTRISPSPDQDIDVLFYGCINERRARVLDALRTRGLTVHAAFNCYGAERDALIARAKVVLNLHYYEAKIFETVRVSYLLANRKAVVAEIDDDTAIDEKLRPAVAGGPYEQLVDICTKLVADNVRRAELEQRGFEIMSSMPEEEYLRGVLKERVVR